MPRWQSLIREVPDFPKPGIIFKDITPLLADAEGLREALAAMTDPWRSETVDCVVGIEARGFVVGAAVARDLGVGFVPIRKAGKLPWQTISHSYGLEYGQDTVEMHADAMGSGRRVVILDDVLATGGTAAAAARLVARTGADLVGFGFLLEIAELQGRSRLDGHRVECAIHPTPPQLSGD